MLTAALLTDFLNILRTLSSLQRHEPFECLDHDHSGNNTRRIKDVA
ncbi:hypothetical protein NSND_62299 [Nitrospira sp. ND1]|nr:hypothetical protein NSND_62299 [Nitrospira sp. ND1]